jgi:hypothetical protein
VRPPTSSSGKCGGTVRDDAFFFLTCYLLLPRGQPPAFPDSLVASSACYLFLEAATARGEGESEDAGQVPGGVGG